MERVMAQDTRDLVAEASHWLERLEGNPSPAERLEFIEWASQHPERVGCMLELHALRIEARRVLSSDPALRRRVQTTRNALLSRRVSTPGQPAPQIKAL